MNRPSSRGIRAFALCAAGTIALSACSSPQSPSVNDGAAQSPEQTTASTPTSSAPVATTQKVTYTVTSDAPISYINYSSSVSGSQDTGNIKEPTPSPFTKTVTLKLSGDPYEVVLYSVSAAASESATWINCSIKVDGKVVKEAKSTGPYANASCFADNMKK